MCAVKLPPETRIVQLRRCPERRGRPADDAKAACTATAPISDLSSGDATVIGVQDRNLLFACYPVRLGRELLGLDTAWMARKFGYSEKEWRWIEANLLVLPPEMRGRIEDFVRTSLAENCRA